MQITVKSKISSLDGNLPTQHVLVFLAFALALPRWLVSLFVFLPILCVKMEENFQVKN